MAGGGVEHKVEIVVAGVCQGDLTLDPLAVGQVGRHRRIAQIEVDGEAKPGPEPDTALILRAAQPAQQPAPTVLLLAQADPVLTGAGDFDQDGGIRQQLDIEPVLAAPRDQRQRCLGEVGASPGQSIRR